MALLLVNFFVRKKMEIHVSTPKTADGNLAANSDKPKIQTAGTVKYM